MLLSHPSGLREHAHSPRPDGLCLPKGRVTGVELKAVPEPHVLVSAVPIAWNALPFLVCLENASPLLKYQLKQHLARGKFSAPQG